MSEEIVFCKKMADLGHQKRYTRCRIKMNEPNFRSNWLNWVTIKNCGQFWSEDNKLLSVSKDLFTFHLPSCLGPEKQGFWPKINRIQMKKIASFEFIHWLVVKKCQESFESFKFFRKHFLITSIFEPLSYKNQVQFFADCQQMDSQDLVISFDYSWFSAKNLAS